MGLLNGGGARVLARVASKVYLPGTLHRATLVRDAVKRVVGTTYDDVPMRYQRDSMSEAARATAGIPATDVRLIVIAHGLGPEPTAEDEFTIPEGRFRVAFCDRDPASSHYLLRGSPV